MECLRLASNLDDSRYSSSVLLLAGLLLTISIANLRTAVEHAVTLAGLHRPMVDRADRGVTVWPIGARHRLNAKALQQHE